MTTTVRSSALRPCNVQNGRNKGRCAVPRSYLIRMSMRLSRFSVSMTRRSIDVSRTCAISRSESRRCRGPTRAATLSDRRPRHFEFLGVRPAIVTIASSVASLEAMAKPRPYVRIAQDPEGPGTPRLRRSMQQGRAQPLQRAWHHNDGHARVHSSGNPALRKPVRKTNSKRSRTAGVFISPLALTRAIVEYLSDAVTLIASASRARASCSSPLRA